MELKKLIFDDLKNLNICKTFDNLYDLLTYSPDVKNGDVSLPCFSFAKVLKISPSQIAEQIVREFKSEYVWKVENINGYVNFYFNKSKVYDILVNELLNKKSIKIGENKTVFVDFSSLNLAKYMHIGHLSTTVIGSVISNIYEYLGYKVIRLNYIGDYGTPFGKMITAIKHWGNENDIEKLGVDYIQDLYVKFNVEAEENQNLNDEARLWFKKIESKDDEAIRIYNKIINVSLLEAKRLCDKLEIYFDSWTGESYYKDKSKSVVQELDKMNLLITSEGAKIVDLEKYGLGACMIEKSDGTSLYVTRDLATAIDRYENYNFDLGIYVTSVQQNLHFARWFKVLDLMGKPYAKNLRHVSYGTYSLPSGKIGSRFGKQALVKDMIELAVSRAKEIVNSRGTKLENVDKLCNDIGIGAIKFGVIKTERNKDCVFDLETSLNFDGETSPYIQYTHARCNSIISKAKNMQSVTNLEDINNLDSFELIKLLNNFEKTILSSAEDFEPCYISRYLLNLCSVFNKFYNQYRIINDGVLSASRLQLVLLVKSTIKTGLDLLGIHAPDVM